MMIEALKSKWRQVAWQRIPFEERLAIIEAEEREYQLPENREKRWDEFLDKHSQKTVGEVIRVRWSSEAYCRAWLEEHRLTGDEPADSAFDPTPRRPVPDWFDRMGGTF